MARFQTYPFHLLFLLVLASTVQLNAQQDTTAIGKVLYFQTTSAGGDAHKNGVTALYFNAGRSLYVHLGAPKSDTSFSTPEFISATVHGDVEGFPILKLHAAQKMYCKGWCPPPSKELCVVTDTMDPIDWLIVPNEHKRFGQYNCRRATGRYRGRTYDVWYAEDLPIPTGPFKLGGLPGLILEAQSTDGVVKFEFMELTLSPSIAQAINIRSGVSPDLSLQDVNQTRQAFLKRQIEFAKSKGVEMTLTIQETIEVFSEN